MKSRCIVLVLAAIVMAMPAVAQDLTTSIQDLEKSVASWDNARLESEAAALKGAIEASDEALASLKKQAKDAADDKKAKIEKQIDDEKAKRKDALDRLQIVVNAMKEKGIDVGDYQVMLINAKGISADNLSADAAMGLVTYWLDKGQTWAIEKGPGIVLKIVAFLVILLIFRVLARFVARVVEKALTMSKVQAPDLLKNFFVNVASKTVFIVGLLIALSVIGVPLGPVLAGVGVLGFVIGFALQDTLGNFAAGVMVLLYRPFDVGDVVTAGGVTGKVSAMTLVSTTLLTPDNQVEIVPNGKIWGDRITNVTHKDTRRVDLVMGIGYEDDIEKAEAVLMDIVTSHPLVLKDPEPAVKLHELADSSVNFVVRPWVKTADYWTVYWDLTKTVKQRFDKEGISIPFPQRDIHIIRGAEALAASK